MSELHMIPEGRLHPDKTTEIIVARGNIRIRTIVIIGIFALLAIIAIGGISGLIINEPVFGKYWQGLQTILSGAIFGLVGFIAGRNTENGKDS